MLLRWERMLKLWSISHMFIVRKAIVIPSSEMPCGHAKWPTSMQWPIIYDASVMTAIRTP